MTPMELVETLAGKGVRLSIEGGDLKCRGPKSALTPETLAQLKAHKAEVLELLTQPPPNDPVDPRRKPGESLPVWLKRVRVTRRRRSGEDDEQRRREPPAEPSVPPPARNADDKPRLDRLAHRHTEKARFFRESMRKVEERRRTGIYPPHIRPVATNGTKPPGKDAS